MPAEAPRRRGIGNGETALFPGCNIGPAYLSSGLGFTEEGALRVTFLVPPEQVEAAFPLHLLKTNPMPLRVEVRVFEPFAERVAEDEARLRVLGDG